MALRKFMVSPSRWYVAICNKTNFDGYYFRKFYLPEKDEGVSPYQTPLTNNANIAAWYFLNRLNYEACLNSCCPLEDFGLAGELIENEE